MWVLLLALMLVTAWANMVEMATFSARPERMHQAIEEGDSRAKFVLRYQRLPLPFLSSIQVFTTAASFVIGFVLGEEFITPLQNWMQKVAVLKSVSPWLAPLSVLLCSTVISLTITNVIPKEIGFKWADSIAIRWAGVMNVLIRIAAPLAWVIRKISSWLEKLLVKSPDARTRVTEADIHTLLNEGEARGSLDRHEAAIVRRALDLSDRPLAELAVARNDIVWVDLAMSPASIRALLKSTPHSYVLACEGKLDCVRGILRSRDWLVAEDQSRDACMRLLLPAPKVRENTKVLDIIAAFGSSNVRAVVIADAEDRVQGLVLMPIILKHLANVSSR